MFRFIPDYANAAGKSDQSTSTDNKSDDDKKSKLSAAGASENKHIKRESNHVYFHAEVNRETIFEVIGHIRKCELENITMAHTLGIDEIPIYLHINSFGGSVFDAMNAIDVIQGCKMPVYTIIEGATASAGTLMSVVGKKRYMRPNSYMLIHQLSAGSWGKMCELEDSHQNNKLIMNRILEIYKTYAKIPKKKLDEILKHDLWWEVDKCMDYGLIDEIWDRS